jgi:hypothetical protein
MPWRRAVSRVLGLLGVLSATGRAQTITLDAGTFTVSERARVVGREQFSLTRAAAGTGWSLELRSDAAWGDDQINWRLQVDSTGRPISARRELRHAGQITARATGAQSRGRFATLWRDGQREAAREFALSASTVVLDQLLVHPLAMAARRLGMEPTGQAITLDGSASAPLRRIGTVADDSVQIAGVRLPARLTVLLWKSDTVRVWADPADRVLAVELPRLGRRAVRDDPPAR